jgi:hypothetical protein
MGAACSFTYLVIGVLGVWRVTHLFWGEDGPFDVFVRIRRLFGNSVFGQMLDCFYCLSLWVAMPFAWILAPTWRERALLWLALSGGASLLERRKEKQDDGMLR